MGPNGFYIGSNWVHYWVLGMGRKDPLKILERALVKTVRVQRKHGEYLRVDIPVDFARALGLRPGDTLIVRLDPARARIIYELPD